MVTTTTTATTMSSYTTTATPEDVALDVVPPSSKSGGNIAATATATTTTAAAKNQKQPTPLRLTRQSSTLKDLSVYVADSTSTRDTVYTFAAIIVAPMVLPILIAMVPMQPMEDGLYENYTWWYQACVDFVVYSMFIVGTMGLFIGISPVSSQLYGQYARTFCIYGLPHVGMFVATAELIAWPIPFSIYLVCGPLYLGAIVFNYATLVKSHIENVVAADGGDNGDDLRTRGKMMVVQFFVQAVLFGLFVGYRAVFSIQTAPIQTVMVVAFFVLEMIGAMVITSLVKRCQFPGTDYVLATEMSYGVVSSLFKALLFPSIAEVWMFGLLVALDALPTVHGVYVSSTTYIRRRGRTTTLDEIATTITTAAANNNNHNGAASTQKTLAPSSSSTESFDPVAAAEEDERVKSIVTGALFSHIAKVLAPSYFVVIITMFWDLNRPAVFMFDDIDKESYLRSLEFAFIDVGVQAVLLLSYLVVLRARGLSAVKIVMVHMNNHLNLWYYALQTSCYMVLVMFILVKHWGCDFTFQFAWLH